LPERFMRTGSAAIFWNRALTPLERVRIPWR
jgi:hypothetical protein